MARFLLVGFIATVNNTPATHVLDALEDRIASRKTLCLDMAAHMGARGQQMQNALHALPEFVKLQVVKVCNAIVR